MSDFFTRLAERTLGLAFIIQPIKPSLFAPQSDPIGGMLLESTEERATDQTPQRPAQVGTDADMGADADWSTHADAGTEANVGMQVDVGTHADAGSRVGSSSTSTTARDTRTAFMGVTSARQSTSDMPINSINDPRTQSHTSPRQLVDRRLMSEQEPFSPHIGQRRKTTSVIHDVEVQALQSQTPVQLLAQSQTHPELRNPAPLPRYTAQENDSNVSGIDNVSVNDNISGTNRETTEIFETSTLVHEQTLSRQVFLSGRKRSPQLSVPPSPAQVQLEATTAEPTIQVTIGRVEVRAVATPSTTASSPQQPARPAAMSLDEYLRQQQQGGRR